MPPGFSLKIDGHFESIEAARSFARPYAKSIGARIIISSGAGAAITCIDPPAKTDVDWDSKSGQAVRLMMRKRGATLEEMRVVTGWTFSQKYILQMQRSFGVVIEMRDASDVSKRTWHARRLRPFRSPVEAVTDTTPAAEHN
ncbi:MAG TPA: hypothetical protein VL614_15160 [Acetobacteraceae bacterium]|nr:hypothetical protein [Acetobacteraceae bacterium]